MADNENLFTEPPWILIPEGCSIKDRPTPAFRRGIKFPDGGEGQFVPLFTNPDVARAYSDNEKVSVTNYHPERFDSLADLATSLRQWLQAGFTHVIIDPGTPNERQHEISYVLARI